jgi:hypothetical protein
VSFACQNFDKIIIPFPYNGMNRDIAPHLMKEDRAWYLENLTQDSLGRGVLRYGVKSFVTVSAMDKGFIMRAFPYIAKGGKEQLLLYCNDFKQDNSAKTIILKENSVTFESENTQQYRNDTFVWLTYTDVDGNKISDKFEIYDTQIKENVVTFKVRDTVFCDPHNTLQVDYLGFSVGCIFLLDVDTKEITLKISDLRTDCIPRAVPFLEKLIICNGLDLMMSWDGTSMKTILQWVKEQAELITLVDRTLSFVCKKNIDKYRECQSVFFLSQEWKVTESNIVENKVTLTLEERPNATPKEIFFSAFPPRCSFLYVSQDRLWGLGQGSAGLSHRSTEESMKVYRTDKPNSIESWTNEQEQAWQFLDLSNKHGVVDNLEAISQSGSRLVFIGREKTQIYAGLVANNTLTWQSTVSSGAMHGNLVFELANDIFFVNAAGLHSFSTLNIGNQFASSSITAINALLKEQLIDALQSNVKYRSSSVFIYNLGAFLGLRIGNNVLNHALFTTAPSFFSLFSGDFQEAQCAPLGNKLFLIKDKMVMIYGDGRDGSEKIYCDTDSKPIVGSWYQPFHQQGQNAFACQRVSCLADYSNGFVENEQNGVFVKIFNEIPKTIQSQRKSLLQARKETLKGNGVLDIDFEGKFKTLSRRLKTQGNESWLYFSVSSQNAYFNVKSIHLYGRRYR